MNQDQLEKLIDKVIDQKLRSFSNLTVPAHVHNGSDAPQINPVNLLGWPTILVDDATVAPADIPLNGTFRFYYDISPVYTMWLFINNTWVSATFT